MSLSADQKSVRLQERDVELLRGLFESRALTLTQATALYFQGKAEPAKKRVQKLKSAGIIREQPRRLYEKSVLFLTTKGFIELSKGGHLADFPRLSVPAFEKRTRISELTLRHELEVQGVKVAFTSGLKAAGIEIKEFSTWPLLSQFSASSGTGRPQEVKPDGFMRIRESDGAGGLFESAFFWEIDRSTETLEKLAERARKLGAQATEHFKELAKRYEVIGDVRGPGLFIGVDFVEDRRTKVPATAACKKAWEFAMDRGLISQFGGFGSNVLKFKPPLTTPSADFEEMLDISEEIVAFIQNEVHGQRKTHTSDEAATVRS